MKRIKITDNTNKVDPAIVAKALGAEKVKEVGRELTLLERWTLDEKTMFPSERKDL